MFVQGLFGNRQRNNNSRIYHDKSIMGGKKNTEIEPFNIGSYDYEYDIDDSEDDSDDDSDDDTRKTNHSSSCKGRWSTCINNCSKNYFSYFSNDKLKDFFRWFMDYAYYEFRISVSCLYLILFYKLCTVY